MPENERYAIFERERKMFKEMIRLSVALFLAVVLVSGCASQKRAPTGFLSDYSKLTTKSDTSMLYINPHNGLGNYSKFIVDPVVVYFHSSGEEAGTGRADLAKMRKHMRQAVVRAFSGRYQIVKQPGAKVARWRIAVTDVKKSSAVLNIVPTSSLAGLGLGGASMEAELLDSLTGEQIGAVVESQKGDRLTLDGLSDWVDIKAVLDGWAQRLRKRLDEAHGL